MRLVTYVDPQCYDPAEFTPGHTTESVDVPGDPMLAVSEELVAIEIDTNGRDVTLVFPNNRLVSTGELPADWYHEILP